MEEVESRRPKDTPFRQQRLKACQPILTPFVVIGVFFGVGALMLTLGFIIWNANNQVRKQFLLFARFCSFFFFFFAFVFFPFLLFLWKGGRVFSAIRQLVSEYQFDASSVQSVQRDAGGAQKNSWSSLFLLSAHQLLSEPSSLCQLQKRRPARGTASPESGSSQRLHSHHQRQRLVSARQLLQSLRTRRKLVVYRLLSRYRKCNRFVFLFRCLTESCFDEKKKL